MGFRSVVRFYFPVRVKFGEFTQNIAPTFDVMGISLFAESEFKLRKFFFRHFVKMIVGITVSGDKRSDFLRKVVVALLRKWHQFIIVRRAGLLWSQQDFEWRWSVPLFKCLTVLEFSFILFDLCLLITFFNFIMNYVPIVTFWIFTYHKIWILSIMFCSIWSYWIIYFLACLEVSWRVVS